MAAPVLPRFKQRDWDDLLDLIEAGQIVPVVGPALLTPPDASGDTFTRMLALRVAAYLELSNEDLPAGRELHEIACRHLADGGEGATLYLAVNRIASEIEPAALPTPLLQLAEITDLRLFLTTTFDSLLARALNEVRGEQPMVKTYRLERSEDIPEGRSYSSLVYHLFGRLTAMPNDFAITEEDTLEFMHALQSEERRPVNLFDELDRRCLLILGCRFPDWLARFFLRMLWKDRLSSPSRRPHFLAESNLPSDPDQVVFLRQFSKATRICPGGGPVEFVGELNARWKQRASSRPSRPRPAAAPAATSGPEVFLSYASEDREIVRNLWKALAAAGVPAFMDQYGLDEGEEYGVKFERKIRDCTLFLPIISRHTLTPDRRFFRIEWRIALSEAQKKSFDPEAVFVLPVIADDTSPGNPALPQEFARLHVAQLADGRASDEFAARVLDLHKRALRNGS